MKIKLTSAFIICLFFLTDAPSVHSFDDPWTKGVNEGAIGSGLDDPWTKGVNEGAIGSGLDDPWTKGVNEGAIDIKKTSRW